MTRREWCFAGVTVLALSLAAVVALSNVTLDQLAPNPAYSPIFAALITAPAILFGAWIAYRGLKLNHESQLNPSRLELYKRQLDLFGDICQQAIRVQRQALHLGELRDTPLAERIGPLARLIRARDNLNRVWMRNVHLIPKHIGDYIHKASDTASDMLDVMNKKEPDPKAAIAHRSWIVGQTDNLVQACIEMIAPDHLSDGWREMLAAHQKRMERCTSERKDVGSGNAV